jgi:hypothetical protein
MGKLDTPDMCALFCDRLDRLKKLCDRLERSQNDPPEYRKLLGLIRLETEELRNTVCVTDLKPKAGSAQ